MATSIRIRQVEQLPQFRYHPDPVATGNFQRRHDFVCGVCGKLREYAYVGPYIERTGDYHCENDDEICPWCIADGSAAREWKASFVHPTYLSEAARTQMSNEALEELEFRTPSFLCHQQEYWLDHHGEAGEFLGAIGHDEYLRLPHPAQIAIREWAGTDGVQKLRNDGDGPTAYLFKCLHCDWYGLFVA
jgi:uncharacterized protein CbrC (UPF0167 family)